jgi:hypothetical protein
MSHCLIFGMTESGKTTLAKRLAHRYKVYHGVPVLVLDSLNDPEWQADFQTTDPDEFLESFWASRRCVAFIDEAGDAVGRYNTVMQRTATRGRHWGHSVHYISQRGVQLAPTVRDQCSHIFLLTSSGADGKIHAQEWNAPILASCNTLQKGEYFHATRFGQVTRANLFGVQARDTDQDIRDGGRELRREEEDAEIPSTETTARTASGPRAGSRAVDTSAEGAGPAETAP